MQYVSIASRLATRTIRSSSSDMTGQCTQACLDGLPLIRAHLLYSIILSFALIGSSVTVVQELSAVTASLQGTKHIHHPKSTNFNRTVICNQAWPCIRTHPPPERNMIRIKQQQYHKTVTMGHILYILFYFHLLTVSQNCIISEYSRLSQAVLQQSLIHYYNACSKRNHQFISH